MNINQRIALQKKRALQGRFVKARLIERGITINDVARNIGVVPQVVTHVLHGRRAGTLRVRPAIARILKMREDQLWPNNDSTKAA